MTGELETERPDAWARDAAAATVVDVVDALCGRLSLESSVGDVQRAARQALGGLEWVSRDAVLGAVESTARVAGLSAQRLSLSARQAFEGAQVPFVIATANDQREPCLVVLDRAGARVQVMGKGWLKQPAFERLAGEGPLQAVGVAAQAPLSPLAQQPGAHALGARVAALMRLERDDLWVVVVYAVAVGLLSLATPIAVQAVVNIVAYAGLFQPLAVLSLLLFAALGCAAVLRALQARVVEFIERRLLVRTALDFAYRFPRLSPAMRQQRFGPHAANRFFEFVNLQKASSALLVDGVAVTLQAGTGLVLMAFYHPYLLAFGLTLTGLVGALLVLPWKRGLSTAYEESSAKYAIAEWLEELSRVPHAFQGRGASRWASEQAELRVRAWLKARSAHFRISFGQMSGALALHALSSTLLLAVGGALVMKNELTLGQLVAAELVVTSVTDALVKLGRLLEKAYDFTVSAEKVGGVVDLKLEDVPLGEHLPGGQSGKRVVAVGAQVAGSRAFTFTVPSAARAAVVEPHGATRHRLAQVLSGHDLPDGGCVELDGIDTRRADLDEVRSRVALVLPQGLFEGSLYDNVAVGRAQVTHEQARAALRRVGLSEAVAQLPLGLETPLSAAGHPLSLDQQAQLLVARAIAGRPRLIVVDDFFDGLSPAARDACVHAVTDGGQHTLIAVCSDAASELCKACVRIEESR